MSRSRVFSFCRLVMSCERGERHVIQILEKNNLVTWYRAQLEGSYPTVYLRAIYGVQVPLYRRNACTMIEELSIVDDVESVDEILNSNRRSIDTEIYCKGTLN